MWRSSGERDRIRPAHSRTYVRLLLAGLALSVVVHAAVAYLAPALEGRRYQGIVGPFRATEIASPPTVHVPAPPEPIRRPDRPEVPEVNVEEVAATGRLVGEIMPKPPALAPPPVTRDSLFRPSYIPHEVAPRLRDRDRVRRNFSRFFPADLARRGVEALVRLWVYVDEGGDVTKTKVWKTSGYPRLDRAARQVARTMEYEPAVRRDRPIGVWVRQMVCFVQEERWSEDDTCLTLVDNAG